MSSIIGLYRTLKEDVVDFHGQSLCTILVYALPIAGAVVGAIFGYHHQNFYVTLQTIGVATLVAGVVCVPAWPFYSRNRIKWKTARH